MGAPLWFFSGADLRRSEAPAWPAPTRKNTLDHAEIGRPCEATPPSAFLGRVRELRAQEQGGYASVLGIRLTRLELIDALFELLDFSIFII